MNLSIIVPVYNVEKYVGECLDSILNQNLDPENYEIILVNDGSTDGSLDIIKTYANGHSHIKIIDKANGGVSQARNWGLAQAKGEYIYFIDSDDFLLPNSLSRLIAVCEQHNLEVLTFLSTRFYIKSTKKSPTVLGIPSSKPEDKLLSDTVSGEAYLATMLPYRNEVWWYVINRAFLDRIGLKFEEDGKYLEDVIFTLSLFLKAERMAHINMDVHRYRIAPGSILTKREPRHYLKLIRDMHSVILMYDPFISDLEKKAAAPACIQRVKTKQQTLVFFFMVRMLQSIISFEDVKYYLDELESIGAYPLNLFIRRDYDSIHYKILVWLFNDKKRYYFIFKVFNPIFKLWSKI